jgi:hypothetical protein
MKTYRNVTKSAATRADVERVAIHRASLSNQ